MSIKKEGGQMNTNEPEVNAGKESELSQRQLKKLAEDGIKSASEGNGIVPIDNILHARRRTAQQAEKNATEASKPKKK